MIQDDDRKRALLDQLTDDDLLNELRSRKRLFRLEAETIAPESAVRSGYPLTEQILNTFRQIGHEVGRRASAGLPVPGCKEDSVKGDGVTRSPYETGRRYTAVLNFVVGPNQ